MQKLIATFLFAAGALVACGSDDIDGDFSGNLSKKGAGSQLSGSCDPEGLPTITAEDPNSFPKCPTAKGSARCIPESKLGAFADKIKGQAAQQTSGEAKFLDTCEGGYCIPDELVKTGGAAPTTCTSLNGEGVCLDLSIPLVGQYDNLLPKDKCSETQRCAPCNNPLAGGAPTGACLIGRGPKPGETCTGGGSGGGAAKAVCPYVGEPLVKVDQFATCGEGAHCVGAALVADENQRKQLGSCQTKEGQAGFCAPDKFIETAGNFVPATCESINKAEGRCMNVVIPMVAAQATFLPQANCAASERCAPCFNPADGKPTGACNLSCDKPANANPTLFPACGKTPGDTRGVCVPTTIIPSEMQSFLKQGTCPTATDKCAPKQVVAADPTFKPASCNGTVKLLGGVLGSIPYTGGVCLPDLIETPGDRGNCQTGEECVPCTNPVTKKATGAPGCPSEPMSRLAFTASVLACVIACGGAEDPEGTTLAGTTPRGYVLCGADQGRCVPLRLVPDAVEGRLGDDGGTCIAGEEVCTPREFVENPKYAPPPCRAKPTIGKEYEGVCLSPLVKVKFLESLGVGKGNCAAETKCLPCVNPLSGEATGAPGCAP